MDLRSPLRDLTAINVINMDNSEGIESISNAMGRPRVSIIKTFDPLYQSPCHNTIRSNTIEEIENAENGCYDNDENYDPMYSNLLNISTVPVNTLIDEVEDFVKSIVNEALSRIGIDNYEENELPEIVQCVFNDTFVNDRKNSNILIDLPQILIDEEQLLEKNEQVMNELKYVEAEYEDRNTCMEPFSQISDNTIIKNELGNGLGAVLLDDDEVIQNNDNVHLQLSDTQLLEVILSNTFTDDHLEKIIKENNEGREDIKIIADLQNIVLIKDQELLFANEQLQEKDFKYAELEYQYQRNLKDLINVELKYKDTTKSMNETIKTQTNDISQMKVVTKSLESALNHEQELVEKLKEQLSQKELEYIELKESRTKQLEVKEDLQKNDVYEELKKDYERRNEDFVKLKSDHEEKSELINTLKKEATLRESEFEGQMNLFDQLTKEQVDQIRILRAEHGLATQHLSNLELAFADVHQKYERCKTIIQGYKTNEDSLQSTLKAFQDNLIKYDQELDAMRCKAKQERDLVIKELLMVKEESKMELHKLMSKIRHLEIKNTALSNSLEQKNKECQELTRLCDEVTAKF